MKSVADRLAVCRGSSSGFDYQRLIMAVVVVAYHVSILLGGMQAVEEWDSRRWLIGSAVPMFFVFSGFLVTGSLTRKGSVTKFLLFRGIRIAPALVVVVLLATFVLGPLATTLSLRDYLHDPLTFHYLRSMLGASANELPGVFLSNPFRHVNTSLWTIYWELVAYLSLCLLALTGILKSRFAVLLGFVALCSVGYLYSHVAGTNQFKGALLLASFYAGVIFFLYQEKIFCSWWIFGVSLLATGFLWQHANDAYLAMLPMAYVVVFVGTFNPPKKTFFLRGDYSFGLYLVHFPLAQAYIHFFPGHLSWLPAMSFTLVLGLLYAFWSWHFVENPIQSRRREIVQYLSDFWARVTTRSIPVRAASSHWSRLD